LCEGYSELAEFRTLPLQFQRARYATGDAILVSLPVDLQDPLELIAETVRYWESRIEMIAGARSNREET
jgi:polyisoprenyl-phosphate glycosyltransferase